MTPFWEHQNDIILMTRKKMGDLQRQTGLCKKKKKRRTCLWNLPEKKEARRGRVFLFMLIRRRERWERVMDWVKREKGREREREGRKNKKNEKMVTVVVHPDHSRSGAKQEYEEKKRSCMRWSNAGEGDRSTTAKVRFCAFAPFFSMISLDLHQIWACSAFCDVLQLVHVDTRWSGGDAWRFSAAARNSF